MTLITGTAQASWSLGKWHDLVPAYVLGRQYLLMYMSKAYQTMKSVSTKN